MPGEGQFPAPGSRFTNAPPGEAGTPRATQLLKGRVSSQDMLELGAAAPPRLPPCTPPSPAVWVGLGGVPLCH